MESRTVVCGLRVASPPACQLRPREKEPAATSPVTVEWVIRKPLRFACVLGAVTKPADEPSQRFFRLMTDLLITAVARPKTTLCTP